MGCESSPLFEERFVEQSIVQEVREMDCRIVQTYYYPDNKEYNYIVRQYGLDGEWFEYEVEVNSGSGIGADYKVFISDDLQEACAEAKAYVDVLINLDFGEIEITEEDK